MWFKSSFTIPAVAAISFCFIGGTVPAVADILHVPADYPTIQAGMDAAQAGDTVLVADGIYTGPGNKNLFYPGVPLTVRSENGAESCIIDCEGVGNAFFLVLDEPPDFIIDGFTIRNGNGRGGGLFIHHNCEATIRNCVITQCTSNTGGAILCEDGSSPTLINCVITANTATNGGGLYIWFGSSPTLINCTITNNIADADGGGVYLFTFGTSPSFINCTITDNLGKRSGGGVFVLSGSPVILNSIVWRNTGEQITDNSETLTVRYSDVEGGWPGTGNIDADPLFLDPDNGDYHLSSGSPCIDAADNTAVPQGIDTDLDGNPRFVDDPATKDTGNGDPPIVDMGTYEFQALSCPWDLDANGSVGATDLLALLAAWGVCDDPANCPADFDNTNDVGTVDLLTLLANWGPCP
ncbi:MAG: right-handed parallel beta-helix repeat-containing protein [Phycisphaerales bacterium]